MPAADTARLIAQLILEDKQFQAAIQRSNKGIGQLETRMGKIGGHAQKGLRNAGSNIEKGITLGVGGAVAGLGLAVKAAVDFEDAFAGVKKTVDETDLTKAGLSFQSLSDDIRGMAREMPIAAEQIASVAEQAGALGIAAPNISEFTRVTSLIGVTTDVAAEDAATSLGQLSNVLKLTQQDYERFGSTLVDLGNKGASTESAILEIASRAGAGAKLLGVATDATLGWSSAVANLGIEVEAGGSALQTFFLKSLSITGAGSQLENFAKLSGTSVEHLTDVISRGGKPFNDMAKSMGVSTASLRKLLKAGEGLDLMAQVAGESSDAFKKLFDQDASAALTRFLGGLGKLRKEEQLGVLNELGFRDVRITRLLLGLAGNTKNLTDSLSVANTAWDKNNALQVEADKRFETTASQLAKLKNNVHDAAITIGSALLPELVSLSKEGTSWINDNQGAIKTFATDLAAGIRDAVGWAKSLNWKLIGESLQTAGMGARAVVDAFAHMPTWIQGAVLTGWGLNKLTGGALGSIVGELGKGLVKGVLGMTAGVVHINAGTVTGVGGGVPGVAGAAGKGLGAVSKMFLVGEAIGLALLVNEVRTGLGDQATAQGKAITDATTKFVTENNLTREQLLNSLAAVDQGIADIKSNPLNVLVQGDALEELQKSREILAKQLATKPQIGGASPDERQEAQRRFDRGISPDAGDSKNLQTTASNTGEMRTEFIADRKAAEVAAARIGEMRTEFNLARGENLTASLNSSSRLDSLRQLTANVQTGVVAAVNNMSANVTAAIAGIRLVPPTINVPRPPTPVVNVNISNRAVNTAVSRNTTFTRPL